MLSLDRIFMRGSLNNGHNDYEITKTKSFRAKIRGSSTRGLEFN
jgi:hypothetical protein